MPKKNNGAGSSSSNKAFVKMPRPKLDVAPFISSTYNMLQNKDAFVDVYDNKASHSDHDNSKYVRWSENGTALLISDETGFATHILPKYFKHKNISSFIRQLNIYGFHKTKQDPQFKEFANPDFQRNKPERLGKIRRRTNRSKAGKAAKLQKMLGAQKGLNEEDKKEFKTLLAEVKYMKSQANNVTSRLRQVERENAKLKQQNNQMLEQQRTILKAESRMRKMIQFMYMMQKQQEKHMLTAGDDKNGSGSSNVRMLKNSPSFTISDNDQARAITARTNSFTFNEMMGRSNSSVADGMFDDDGDDVNNIEPIVRAEYTRQNTESDMLDSLFDSPRNNNNRKKASTSNNNNNSTKTRSLSRGGSFLDRSSITKNGSSTTLGKRTKALSPSPTDAFFTSSSPTSSVNSSSSSSSKKKRKLSHDSNNSSSNSSGNIDDDIANLASNTTNYYTRLGSFEESLGRSYGNTDIDSLLSTPMFDEDVLNENEVAEVVD